MPGFFVRRIAVMAACLLLALCLSLGGCAASNPHLKPAIDAGQEKRPQDAHRLFRLAIEATPDRPNPFIYYVRWASEHYQSQSEHLGQVVEQLAEATELQRLAAQLQAGITEMEELSAYLKERCRCDVSDWANALSYYEKRREDLNTLLRHFITQANNRRDRLAHLSQQATQVGIGFKDKGLVDEAANHFSQALSYDRGNELARSMRERLEALEVAELAVHERRLDQAIALFEKLQATYPDDAHIQHTCRQSLANLRIVRGQALELLNQAERTASRRVFDLSASLLERALLINAELSEMVDARRRAVFAAKDGLEHSARNRHDQALAQLRLAESLWNFTNLDKWIVDAERKQRQAKAQGLVEQAAVLMAQGDLEGGRARLDQAQELAVTKAPILRAVLKVRRDAQAHFLRMARDAASRNKQRDAWRYFGYCNEIIANSGCQRDAALAKKRLVEQLRGLVALADDSAIPEARVAALHALGSLEALSAEEQARLAEASAAVQQRVGLERLYLDTAGLSADETRREQRRSLILDALAERAIPVFPLEPTSPEDAPHRLYLSVAQAPENAAFQPPAAPPTPGQALQSEERPVNSLILLYVHDDTPLFEARLDAPPETELDLSGIVGPLAEALARYLDAQPKPDPATHAVRQGLEESPATDTDWLELAETFGKLLRQP